MTNGDIECRWWENELERFQDEDRVCEVERRGGEAIALIETVVDGKAVEWLRGPGGSVSTDDERECSSLGIVGEIPKQVGAMVRVVWMLLHGVEYAFDDWASSDGRMCVLNVEGSMWSTGIVIYVQLCCA